MGSDAEEVEAYPQIQGRLQRRRRIAAREKAERERDEALAELKALQTDPPAEYGVPVDHDCAWRRAFGEEVARNKSAWRERDEALADRDEVSEELHRYRNYVSEHKRALHGVLFELFGDRDFDTVEEMVHAAAVLRATADKADTEPHEAPPRPPPPPPPPPIQIIREGDYKPRPRRES